MDDVSRSKARALPWTRWGLRPQTPICSRKGTDAGSTMKIIALQKFLRGVRWLILGGISAALAVALFLFSIEYYQYLTRNEAKAQEAATAEFRTICIRHGLDPALFHGPVRPDTESDNKSGTYTFDWAISPSETVSVTVMYLPYDMPYSISAGLTEGDPRWKR